MIPAIRGTHDILPGEVERWQCVEASSRRVFERYGYAEIRTPIIEREELFAKGTGETTDIVQKEMYAFTDKGGERITLRPEATPSLVRAFVEHSLEQAMAVAEDLPDRPDVPVRAAAEGALPAVPPARRRGVRRHGPADRRRGDRPRVDAGARAGHRRRRAGRELGRLPGVPAGVRARRWSRRSARTSAKLCGDCQRRAATNPLRIFDCKVPAGSADHRRAAALDRLPVRGVPDALRRGRAVPRRLRDSVPRLAPARPRASTTTRGRRSRSWPGNIGAQNAILGGGRYDGLVKHLGGPDRVGHRVRRGHRAARARDARAAGARRRAAASSSRRWASRRARRRSRCCATCGGPASRRRWSTRGAASSRR